MKRFVRESLVLILFCLALWGLTRLGGGSESNAGGLSNFSDNRRRADEEFKNENWAAALERYKKLTLEDAYNELAQFRYAKADLKLLFQEYDSIVDSPDDEGQTVVLPPDMVDKIQNSIAIQKRSLEFSRHRKRTLRSLMVLHCMANDKAAAMATFYDFMRQREGVGTEPLYNDTRLRLLHTEEDFLRYLRTEIYATREHYGW